MMTQKKAFLWKGYGSAAVVLCIPIGIYSYLQANKLWRSYKIGDYKTAERCKENIKKCWIAIGILYAIIIIAIIITS